MIVNHHAPLLSLVLAIAVTVLLWTTQVSADVQAVGESTSSLALHSDPR